MPRKSKQTNGDMINFYELKKVDKFKTKSVNPNYNKHYISVPFRGVLIGSSGSGKTNLLLNIINQFSNTFNHIYIYTQAVEPLYEYLESQLGTDLLTIKYSLNDCRTFKETDYYGSSLVIFDDQINEKDQKCINELYIRGRKIAGGISLLYLTQSYFKVPKIIRLQCQYIFILKVSGVRDLKMILSEYSLSATKEQLTNMYEYSCNSGTFGSFMLIDLVADQNKTYRKNFTEYLSIDDF
jgi:hypothetical protein